MKASAKHLADKDSATVEKSESDFFNQFIMDNAGFDPFEPSGWDVIQRCFRQHLEPRQTVSILDIGCGSGASRKLYIDHARTYIGIDLSESAVRKARADHPTNHWLVANALNLPLPDDTLDVVAFSSVLHHIPDFTPALCEAMRVLKPGGLVFAFDPNVFHPALGMLRHPRSPLYLSKGVSPNERPLSPAALRSAFTQAGLTGLQQVCRSSIAYRHVDVKLLNHFLTIYNFLDRCLTYTGLERWMGAFIITTGRKPNR